ncbi:hypothetical protein ACTU6V_02710 [Microbacterium sp. A204]|uniref:hypothetical protein n=1 Tax=Microbacterium sp. A204 TaxID=3457321 RepID=UPI003FD361E5
MVDGGKCARRDEAPVIDGVRELTKVQARTAIDAEEEVSVVHQEAELARIFIQLRCDQGIGRLTVIHDASIAEQTAAECCCAGLVSVAYVHRPGAAASAKVSDSIVSAFEVEPGAVTVVESRSGVGAVRSEHRGASAQAETGAL